MPTSAVGSATTTGLNTLSTGIRADRGVASLRSEDFFRMLITEMQQQDPLEPNKTADMIGQVAQIRSIELSQQLTNAMNQITSQQHTSGASALLGKHITARLKADDGSEYEVAGVVTGVRFDANGAAVLELDNGQAVPLSAVQRISAAENAPQAPGQSTATGSNAASSSTTAGATAATSTAPKPDAARPRAGLIPWLKMSGSFDL